MVSGKLSHELEVNAPAGDVWAVFDGLKVAKLIEENLTQFIQKVDVLQGDGGVGTIVCLKFVPALGYSDSKEKITKIDHENRIKETEVVEGGYLALGFTSYRYRVQIVEKGKDSSIIKSNVEYEANDENVAKHATVEPVQNVAVLVQKHVTKA
ncbi:hypothetical protein UlMin_024845 [Ulmus minor]